MKNRQPIAENHGDRVVEVAPGETVTIKVVVELRQPPVTPPPVDPPTVPPPPVDPHKPPKPGDKPLSLVVPDDGPLDVCTRQIAEGGTIRVRAGTHVVSRSCDVRSKNVHIQGEVGAVVTIDPAAYAGDGAVIKVSQPGCVIDGLTVDAQHRHRTKCIRVENNAHETHITGCEIRNAGWHAVDIDGDDCIVQQCQIHHALMKNGDTRDDAHGTVTESAQRLQIIDCDIWNCSGDCWQGDRGAWNHVLIDGCKMWLEPLAADMAGYKKGDLVGENAIDTKTAKPGQRLVIKNCQAWGYRGTIIKLPSVFNLKEGIDAVVEGCTVRDSHIAFRLPAYRDGKAMKSSIVGCKVEGCDVAFRVEDQSSKKPTYVNIIDCDVSADLAFDFVDVSKGDAVLGPRGMAEPSRVETTVFRKPIETRGGDKTAITSWLLSPASGNSVVE